MNYPYACSSALLCSLLATGCSTQKIKQANNVSKTAFTYTSLITDLLGITRRKVIDFDSKILSENQTGANKAQKLNSRNKAMEEWISINDQIRDQNKLLQNYFKSLQAMVDSSSPNDMGESVGSISGSISNVNDNLVSRRGKNLRNLILTNDQMGYINGISAVLIGNHYATKVRQALIRDRSIIARQISLQEQQLKEISDIYLRRLRMENADHYANSVHGPFVSNSPKNKFDADTWAENRRKWFENKNEPALFIDIQKANVEFKQAWIDILEGKKDAGAVTAILSNVDKFVENAYQLQDSYRNSNSNDTYSLEHVGTQGEQ